MTSLCPLAGDFVAVVALAIPGIVPSMKNGEDEPNVPRGMFDACLMPCHSGGDLTASMAGRLDARAAMSAVNRR